MRRQALTGAQVSPGECSLLVTEPLFNLPALRQQLDELVFEQLGCAALLACAAPTLAALDPACGEPSAAAAAATPSALRARAALVLDCGFSASHAAPVFDGRCQLGAVRRVNVGGKALTNQLKELISFRAMNMMDEFLLMERVKERLCYVAPDLQAELAAARAPRPGNRVARDFCLPDGVTVLRGYVVGEDEPEGGARRPAGPGGAAEQLLPLCNERFLVPEALLHPSDIGVPQAGLAEAAALAVAACPADTRGLLWANVLLCGGTAALPGLEARLRAELRPLVPAGCELSLRTAPQPALAAWRGGAALGASEEFGRLALTRAEYAEQGSSLRVEYEKHGVAPPRGRLW